MMHDTKPGPGLVDEQQSRPAWDGRRTARITGLWYLALAVVGGIGFLLIRSQIYIPGDPAATLANLVDRTALARLGVVMELLLVLTQAIAAVWFYKLFRSFSGPAAWSVAGFGLMNAAAVLVSFVFMMTALAVAGDGALAPGGDAAATVQLMYEMSSGSWQGGGLFFGLWLIPMGHVAGLAGMPRWLGRSLIVGGVGYVLSTFSAVAMANPPTWLVEWPPYLATIGEVWMIGYLLGVGLPTRSAHSGPGTDTRSRSISFT